VRVAPYLHLYSMDESSADEGDDDTTGEGRTRGIECLACANYQAFEDEVDKVAARRGVDRAELRNALAHWVDHDLDTAAESYDVPREIIVEGRDACRRAANNQYPEFMDT